MTAHTYDLDDYLFPWEASTHVVMQHGFARNSKFWNKWVPTLTAKHRVLRPTMQGCGGTMLPAHRIFTPENLVADLVNVMDVLEVSNAHFVGEASGGILGLCLAAKFPARVRSLVLCDTPSAIPHALKSSYALGEQSPWDAIRSTGVRDWCLRTIEGRLSGDGVTPALKSWYADQMSLTPAEVAADLLEVFSGVDVTSLLGEVQVPVLLLCGEYDSVWAEEAMRMARLLPRASVHRIRGCRVGVHVLDPLGCAQAAIQFWDDNAA